MNFILTKLTQKTTVISQLVLWLLYFKIHCYARLKKSPKITWHFSRLKDKKKKKKEKKRLISLFSSRIWFFIITVTRHGTSTRTNSNDYTIRTFSFKVKSLCIEFEHLEMICFSFLFIEWWYFCDRCQHHMHLISQCWCQVSTFPPSLHNQLLCHVREREFIGHLITIIFQVLEANSFMFVVASIESCCCCI